MIGDQFHILFSPVFQNNHMIHELPVSQKGGTKLANFSSDVFALLLLLLVHSNLVIQKHASITGKGFIVFIGYCREIIRGGNWWAERAVQNARCR